MAQLLVGGGDRPLRQVTFEYGEEVECDLTREELVSRTSFDRDAAGLYGDIAVLTALADGDQPRWFDLVACARYGYEADEPFAS